MKFIKKTFSLVIASIMLFGVIAPLQNVSFATDKSDAASVDSGVTDATVDAASTTDSAAKAIAMADIPTVWTGEYDGHNKADNVITVVRRNLSIGITNIEAGGAIQGICRFSPSPLADPSLDRTGSYYFSGTVNAAACSISLQGYKWIDSVDNMSFVSLSGRMDLTTYTIHGTSDNGIWSMKADRSSVKIPEIGEINMGPYALEGGEIELLGKKIPLVKIESALKFGKHLSLKVVSSSNDTLRVIAGYKDGNTTDKEESYWLKEYQEIKSLYRCFTVNRVSDNRLWNQFSSLRGKMKDHSCRLFVDCSMNYCGFFEWKKTENGYVFSDGGLITSLAADTSVRHYFGPLVYVFLGVKTKLDTEFSFFEDGMVQTAITALLG